jgi:cytochrome P450
MRACLYYTLTHPRVYRRLQAEIDEYFNARPSQQSITYNDARQLPYLHAVISEATRLHPSIVFQLLRKAPADFVIDGIKIPPGTEVGVSPRAQNRDTAIWGDDANEFRPERWLENEEQAKYFENITMTFGGNGPRMCIGRNLALVGFLFCIFLRISS